MVKNSVCKQNLDFEGCSLYPITQFCPTDNSPSGIPCIAPGRAYNLQYGTDRQIDLRSRDVNLKMKCYLASTHRLVNQLHQNLHYDMISYKRAPYRQRGRSSEGYDCFELQWQCICWSSLLVKLSTLKWGVIHCTIKGSTKKGSEYKY